MQGVHSYHMIHLVNDIAGVIRALRAKQVTLMAHDWGGAGEFAQTEGNSHMAFLPRPRPLTTRSTCARENFPTAPLPPLAQCAGMWPTCIQS